MSTGLGYATGMDQQLEESSTWYEVLLILSLSIGGYRAQNESG